MMIDNMTVRCKRLYENRCEIIFRAFFFDQYGITKFLEKIKIQDKCSLFQTGFFSKSDLFKLVILKNDWILGCFIEYYHLHLLSYSVLYTFKAVKILKHHKN